MAAHASIPTRIAVDIGNSRFKLGRFAGIARAAELPVPSDTLEMPLQSRAGEFSSEMLDAWCERHVAGAADWLIASVHRGAAERLTAKLTERAKSQRIEWSIRALTHRDVPLAIEVEQPERVGVDRLLAAAAADRLRRPNHAAIVAGIGTAIHVDLVTAAGAFAGGAILPGLAMAARALHEQTDALPQIAVDQWSVPPEALGKATVPAMESGLFWGAVGAIRELVSGLSVGLAKAPDVFVSGGASPLIAEVLAEADKLRVRHVPHLVLSGIALVDVESRQKGTN